jgi:hypothetical protein
MYVNVPSEVFEVFQKVLEGKLDMWTDGDVIYVGEEKRPYFPVLMIGKGRIFIIEDLIEQLKNKSSPDDAQPTPSLFFPSPSEPSSAPVPHSFKGRLGRGVWRMGLSGVSELSPAPWRLCPTWNRPGVRLELSPGTPPWRWSYLRPPMWGDRDGPQQGGCPEKPESNHAWAGAISACVVAV